MFIFFFIPLGRSVSITRKKKLDPTQEVMLELGVVLQKKEPKDPPPHHIRTRQEVCLEQALVSAYRLLPPFDYFRITVLNVFIVASNSLFRRIAHHFIVCCRYGLLMDI